MFSICQCFPAGDLPSRCIFHGAPIRVWIQSVSMTSRFPTDRTRTRNILSCLFNRNTLATIMVLIVFRIIDASWCTWTKMTEDDRRDVWNTFWRVWRSNDIERIIPVVNLQLRCKILSLETREKSNFGNGIFTVRFTRSPIGIYYCFVLLHFTTRSPQNLRVSMNVI